MLAVVGCGGEEAPPKEKGEATIVLRSPEGKEVRRGVRRLTVDVGDYDLACTTDTDCTVVETAPCGFCACPRVPIATSMQGRFDEEVGQIHCPQLPEDAKHDCAPCPPRVGVCQEGVCVAAASRAAAAQP